MLPPADSDTGIEAGPGPYFQLDLGLASQISASTGHRHQRSLESVLDFRHVPLQPSERVRAEKIFSQILDGFVPVTDLPPSFDSSALLRLSLRYNPSEQGRDNFLNYVLRNYIPTSDNDGGLNGRHSDTEGRIDNHVSTPFSRVLDHLEQTLLEKPPELPSWFLDRTTDLAKHLIYFFFLPLKKQAFKTPQPTPHLTPVGDGMHTPTYNRLSNLRAVCLVRDGHRCVISGHFDASTARERRPLLDDSGHPLTARDILSTEVAHIIPHALGETDHENTSLPPHKAMFWDVMRLFYPRVEQLLNGGEIDRPFNAMTMTSDLHRAFGNLEWYLEEDNVDPEPNAYIFKDSPGDVSILNPMLRPQNARERVRFTGTGADAIDLPDSGLLALHRACAIILGMSGAGEHIDKLLRDDENIRLGKSVEELQQGSLDLKAIVSWRLAIGSMVKSLPRTTYVR